MTFERFSHTQTELLGIHFFGIFIGFHNKAVNFGIVEIAVFCSFAANV